MATQNPAFPTRPGAEETRTVPGLFERLRRQAPWWLLPVTVVTVLGAFSVYAAWTALIGHNQVRPYLSPFYSPQIALGRTALSPALFAVWMPLIFRATCYYYRKAYYRSFFWDPPACAVPELRKRPYRGESAFPLFLNNLHRFTLYIALVVLGFLWYDAIQAFTLDGHLYLGLGTGLMLLNVVLLSGYTFSCHSLRHLVGGRLDCFTCSPIARARHSAWKFLSTLNERHPTWAWVSMFSVVGVDVYIRMLEAGWFLDPHRLF